MEEGRFDRCAEAAGKHMLEGRGGAASYSSYSRIGCKGTTWAASGKMPLFPDDRLGGRLEHDGLDEDENSRYFYFWSVGLLILRLGSVDFDLREIEMVHRDDLHATITLLFLLCPPASTIFFGGSSSPGSVRQYY